MPSPFPGMNPYLEQDDVWEDFHNSFIVACRAQLTPKVQPNYFVKVEQQLYIHEPPASERRYLGKGDIGVGSIMHSGPSQSVGVAPEAPAYGFIPAPLDVEKHIYLEIRDKRDRELVTVVEVLSPSNKRPGADRETYLAKRRQLYLSAVHLVEIDLLRGGPRLPVQELPDCAYCVLVSRAGDRPRVALWPLALRDRLPTIAIPLRPPDPDASLDLQEVLHRCYDAAGYGDYIYKDNPQPPLSSEDAAWAALLLPS